MRPSNATILLKESVLQTIGAIILFISVFGFLLSLTVKYYSITNYDDTPPKQTYSYTTGTLAYVQGENPGAEVKRIDDGFPVKSTMIMFFGLFILSRKHKSRTQDEKTVRLLDALKHNPKVKLVKLSNKLGIDEKEIVAKLPDLNQHHGTKYAYHYQSKMIVDHESTIEWKLGSKCENCGATSALSIIVSIETDSLNCPYCDSKINDDEFENCKQNALVLMQPPCVRIVDLYLRVDS